jgi:hypothetical protein
MEHDNPRTFTTTFTPNADTTGEQTIGNIDEGAAFKSQQLEVRVTSDPAGDLELQLLDGQEQVAPQGDPLTVTESDITLNAGNGYDVGDAIELRFSTTGSYTGGEVMVLVHGRFTPDGG